MPWPDADPGSVLTAEPGRPTVESPMLIALLVTAALAPGCAPSSGTGVPHAAQDLGASLERLRAPELGARAAAQETLGLEWVGAVREERFLGAAHAVTTRADALADDLAGRMERLSPDARREISIVLASEDELLGVAIRLAAVGPPIAQELGRDALRGQLDRWSASAFDEPDVAVFDIPRQKLDLPRDIVDSSGLRVAVDPNRGGGHAAFDRLDRLASGPIPIVVDPGLVERMIRRPAPRLPTARLEGSWTYVLEQLCLAHGAAYQLQGYRFPGERRSSDAGAGAPMEAGSAEGFMRARERAIARPWIHLVGVGTTEMAMAGQGVRQRGGDVVITWCLDAVREGNLIRQAAAARALATLDWPAAVVWLEQRWLATGDVTALEGLLAAAARGRVAPALQREDVVRAVLALMDDSCREVYALRVAAQDTTAAGTQEERAARARDAESALDRRAHRFALGLGGLSPFVVGTPEGRYPTGAPMMPVLLDGYDAALPTGKWLRLAAAEGLGLTNSRVAELALDVLAGRVDARSRRQALRTLLVAQPMRGQGGVVLARPADFFGQRRGNGSRSDGRGVGLELGLVRAVPREEGSEAGGWVESLAEDGAALSELLVWAALLAADAQGDAPTWVLSTVAAAIRAAEDRSFTAGASPFEGAAAAADLDAGFAALLRWVEPGLDPALRLGLRRAALRAGLASVDVKRSALAAASAALVTPDSPGEAIEEAWLDLAALVGDEELGERALGQLEASLVRSLTQGGGGRTSVLVEGAERAAWGLEAARRDDAAETFLGALRRAATGAKHPLAQRFYRSDWPSPRKVGVRDLERIELVL